MAPRPIQSIFQQGEIEEPRRRKVLCNRWLRNRVTCLVAVAQAIQNLVHKRTPIRSVWNTLKVLIFARPTGCGHRKFLCVSSVQSGPVFQIVGPWIYRKVF